jgi:hypothetical protein
MAAAKPAPGSKAAKVTKVSLLIGTGIAFAAAKTQFAPLVVAVLVAAIIYQFLNL